MYKKGIVFLFAEVVLCVCCFEKDQDLLLVCVCVCVCGMRKCEYVCACVMA